MFLNGPIYKDVLRIVSPNNLIYEKSIFKLWEKYLFIHQLCVYRDMKHLDNLEWIQEERLLFSVTPRVTLTHVSYPPNFLHVVYLTETRGGAEHNYAEEALCSRWYTVRGPLNITFAYYSFTSVLSHPEVWFAFTACKLQCFRSYPTCLHSYAWFCLFVKQVGTRGHLYWASVSLGA